MRGLCESACLSLDTFIFHVDVVQHDPATTQCSPGGSVGNFIMYAHATSGTEPNNDEFSPCSISAIGNVIRAKASNCFAGVYGDSLHMLNSDFFPMSIWHG